jgi:hypothetical protein
LLISIVWGIVMHIVETYTSDRLKDIGSVELVESVFSWVLNGLLLYYNWHLIKIKVLR